GLTPFEAVAAPRVHCEGGPVFVEGRVSQAAREALRSAGFDLREMPASYGPGFGRNQLIVIDADGEFRGASDPRRDGGIAACSGKTRWRTRSSGTRSTGLPCTGAKGRR